MHNPEKPAIAGRAWILAAVLLVAALMCAQGLVSARSGGRIFPLGWPLSFMPPPGFTPLGHADLPFEEMLGFEGRLAGNAELMIFTGVAPLQARSVPELTALQVWTGIQALAPRSAQFDFTAPRPSTLGGRQAWLLGDLATEGAIVRCTAVGDGLVFAAAVTPQGGTAEADRVFDEFCASLRITRHR